MLRAPICREFVTPFSNSAPFFHSAPSFCSLFFPTERNNQDSLSTFPRFSYTESAAAAPLPFLVILGMITVSRSPCAPSSNP